MDAPRHAKLVTLIYQPRLVDLLAVAYRLGASVAYVEVVALNVELLKTNEKNVFFV